MSETIHELQMTNRLWTNEETEILISTMEAAPELWDPTQEDYKNRAKRTDTIEQIAAQFQTDTKEISRKLHNLRTQFNNELRKMKIKKNRHGGDEYKSSWKFFDSLRFMMPFAGCNKTSGSLPVSLENCCESMETPESCESVEITQPKVKKSKCVQREDLILETTLEVLHKSFITMDDDQIFGNFVASALRNMNSKEIKRKLKRKLQAAILEMEELDASLTSSN